MAAPSTDELVAGLKGIIADMLLKARDDAARDILPEAQAIAERAAKWGQRALAGDPAATAELTLVQAQLEGMVAIVARRASKQVTAEIVAAVQLVIKFLIAAAVVA